uniref:Uncharacterized protein n=1 Tax=Glossina palpalis gambiensis TaxID=67801 RepID=A0A1B0B313_9MUSC
MHFRNSTIISLLIIASPNHSGFTTKSLHAKIFILLTKAKKTLSSNIEDLCHQPQHAFIKMVVLIAE